jgi:hypothetical protein
MTHRTRGNEQLSAATLLPAVAGVDPCELSTLRTFGYDLDVLGAFDGLSDSDAKRVAVEVAHDLTQNSTPGSRLFERARTLIGDIMQPGDTALWDDPQRVYRALLITATLALSSATAD